MHLLVKFFSTVFALLLITHFVPGFIVPDIYTAIIAAFVLGLINLFIRPIILLLTLPINLLTLGLFTFIVNALLLWGVASFVPGFTVTGFTPALLGALIIAIVHWLAEKIA